MKKLKQKIVEMIKLQYNRKKKMDDGKTGLNYYLLN
jgi:hypothetical protein